MLRVLGFLAASPSVGLVHSDTVAQFLQLEDGELDALLNAIASLIPSKETHGHCKGPKIRIAFYHKSINDFLRHESRAREFYIAANVFYAFVRERCLDIASQAASPSINNGEW